MKNAFAHNAFAASGGISQTAADARYVLKAAGSFTGLTGAGFRDTSAAFDVTQTFTSSTVLDAARSITWDVKNASHELKFTAASIVTFPAGTVTLAQLGANTFTGYQKITSAHISICTSGPHAFRCRDLADTSSYATLDGSNGLLMSQNNMIGWNSWFSAGNERLMLSAQVSVSNVLTLGSWEGSATPAAVRIAGQFGAGANITGGDLNFGTQGTGTGTGGRINLQFHAAGASSSTLGTLVDVLSVVGVGTIRITNIPTSSAGLSTGDVYSNAGILTIV